MANWVTQFPKVLNIHHSLNRMPPRKNGVSCCMQCRSYGDTRYRLEFEVQFDRDVLKIHPKYLESCRKNLIMRRFR